MIFKIKFNNGEYNMLDKQYNMLVLKESKHNYERWIIYNEIMEAIHQLGKKILFESIKYDLVDQKNPNELFISIIENNKDLPNEVKNYKKILKEFKSIDFVEKFL